MLSLFRLRQSAAFLVHYCSSRLSYSNPRRGSASGNARRVCTTAGTGVVAPAATPPLPEGRAISHDRISRRVPVTFERRGRFRTSHRRPSVPPLRFCAWFRLLAIRIRLVAHDPHAGLLLQHGRHSRRARGNVRNLQMPNRRCAEPSAWNVRRPLLGALRDARRARARGVRRRREYALSQRSRNAVSRTCACPCSQMSSPSTTSCGLWRRGPGRSCACATGT